MMLDPKLRAILDDTLSVAMIPRVAMVNYTGNGGTSQVVSLGADVDWTPKLLLIMIDGTAAATQPVHIKSSLHGATLCQIIADADVDIIDNAIIALAAGSFTVDDAGGDAHPNKNTVVYIAIALGW